MLGITLPALVSTYSNVELGPGALDSPPFSVTITSAGPAPSCGAGASGGSVWRAGGNVAVIVVGLSTVKRPGANCAAPTSTPATSDTPPDSNPVPVIVTRSPPAVLP